MRENAEEECDNVMEYGECDNVMECGNVMPMI